MQKKTGFLLNYFNRAKLQERRCFIACPESVFDFFFLSENLKSLYRMKHQLSIGDGLQLHFVSFASPLDGILNKNQFISPLVFDL
jgi:hypothetical protein